MKKSLVRKLCLLVCSVVLIHFFFVYAKAPANTLKVSNSDSASSEVEKAVVISEVHAVGDSKIGLYETLDLNKLGLSRQAFEYALKGYNHFLKAGKLDNERILSIIDFSLPSAKKRLFIIDVKQGKLLFHTYVSHGRGSGREKATDFSNQPESFKSSLGFFITRDTYIGKHGFSLRLDGEERGINDNAMSRAIVMHAASYVHESLIASQGYIGRSLGCPAVSEKLHRPIIDKIKNGSCLFLYSPNKNYTSNSKILNREA